MLDTSAFARGFGGQAILDTKFTTKDTKNTKNAEILRRVLTQFFLATDCADFTDLLAGLGALGLARLDANIRQSQNLQAQAISTNGRQKLCKPAPLQLGHTLKV